MNALLGDVRPQYLVERTAIVDGVSCGAVFSPCERYRYVLWREWDTSLPSIAFCMLNPSTADERKNDATIERCKRRAEMLGYGRIDIVNLFAFRSTDPRLLYKQADPVGPHNFEAIVQAVKRNDMLICGWGRHGAFCRMGANIKHRMQQFYPSKLRVLVVNKDGSPKHPLYIAYDVHPREWAA
jgi:hypothetical protein